MRKVLFGFKGLTLLLSLSIFTFFGCSKERVTQLINDSRASVVNNSQAAPGRYIITLKEAAQGNISESMLGGKIHQLLADHKLESMQQKVEFQQLGSGFAAHLEARELEQLRKDNRLDIEQDQIIMLSATAGSVTSTQPKQIEPWGVKKLVAGNGKGKTAWIIDTGIDSGHPDLEVDKTNSKSFLTSSSGGNWSQPWDENGHGTHVAGIIGAKDNTIGVIGVAAGAKVVSVRVLDKNGSGYISTLISGINYVAAHAKAGDVANISIGCSPSTALDNAVKALANKGVFIAIAAGNSSADAANYSPSRVKYKNVWTVSAMDSLGNFSSFSNYGSSTIYYTCPGSYIYSTFMGGKYKKMSGTSMASPHLAGVLLMTGGKPVINGAVSKDPDSFSDKIPKI